MDGFTFIYLLVVFVIVPIIVIRCVKKEKEENAKKPKVKTYKEMTDKELIRDFEHCADEINLILSTCGGLHGLGSTFATNKANSDMDYYKKIGTRVADELASRGYTIDRTILNAGHVHKAYSTRKSIIGGAIAGGIIAGGPGAIVGALNAMDKNSRGK